MTIDRHEQARQLTVSVGAPLPLAFSARYPFRWIQAVACQGFRYPGDYQYTKKPWVQNKGAMLDLVGGVALKPMLKNALEWRCVRQYGLGVTGLSKQINTFY